MEVIDLFSGCGGCSLGLRDAGFDVVLAADNDVDACATYSANLDADAVWTVDLSSVTPTQVRDAVRNGGGADIPLIVGGPPCQGFSSAGARNWNDPRNTLLHNFVEVVTHLKPTWFVMENVEGLLTADEGFYITEIVTRFLEAGYWVRVKKVYMERYGVPQRRKRVFIVGNLEECEFDFPNPHYAEGLSQTTFDDSPLLTIMDAIGDLPPPSEKEDVALVTPAQNEYQASLRNAGEAPVSHHQAKPLNDINQRRIHGLAQGATMRDLPEALQHPSFTRRALRRVMDGTPTEKRGGAPSGLKRLYAHQPSLTITSAASSEFVHPTADRLLTLRECIRVQSFPDSFRLCGSWSSVATQIGNAVPPLFMKALATHIRESALWTPVSRPKGRWLGIDATKSTGMSPALVKTLARIRERTHAYVG